MKRRPVPAVSRAIAALRLLGESDQPLGVHAIARATGMVPSTCLHTLRELAVEGLVGFDETTKLYSLAPGILALASKMLRPASLTHMIQPLLSQLTDRYPVSVGLMQILDPETMIVTAMSNRNGLGLKVELGTVLSTLTAATGRCIAGFGGYSEPELKERFRTIKWANPLSFEVWRGQCAQAAQLGYGVDHGNRNLGIIVISAPILDGAGAISHSIAALGIREEIEHCGIERIAVDLKKIADSFSSPTGLKISLDKRKKNADARAVQRSRRRRSTQPQKRLRRA